MPYASRKRIYSEIEKIRKRPLLVYVTNTAVGRIAADVVPCFLEQIQTIHKRCKKIDLLIVSNGGDAPTAWRIMTLLRERFDEVNVLLPYVAYSAATLMSLGADNIIMHPFSNLGPVDPQITIYKTKDGSTINYGSEDIRNYFNFIKEDLNVTDQDNIIKNFELLVNDLGSIPIGQTKRSTKLSLTLSEQLLLLHMTDNVKAKSIAEKLSYNYYHHGYTISPSEAKKLELPIADGTDKLYGLMWKAWCDIRDEMNCETEFNPIDEILNSNEGKEIMSINRKFVDIPSNLPPEIMNQIYHQITSNLHIYDQKTVNLVKCNAILESVNLACIHESKMDIIFNRDISDNLNYSVIPHDNKWRCERDG